MKYKTTQKAVYRDFGNVLQVGYCNLQHLLSGISPDAYTTRIEGWAADVYEFGRVAIVTGYAPFGNVVPSYDLCRAYDDRARADYGTGLYVFAPGDPSDNWLQYCQNIDYLDGWLYGCVQGACRLKRVEMEV